jgi:hypothetical protein
MSSSELIRWSGLAAVAGGVSLGIAELVALSFFGLDFRQTATTGTYAVYSLLIMITGVLLPLGLVGLYVRQSEAAEPQESTPRTGNPPLLYSIVRVIPVRRIAGKSSSRKPGFRLTQFSETQLPVYEDKRKTARVLRGVPPQKPGYE